MAATQTEKAAGGSKSSAARSEKTERKPHTVKLRGEDFTFPAKPPFSVLKYLQGGEEGTSLIEIAGFATALLGEEQMGRFYALDLDLEEGAEALTKLLEKGLKPYGINLGG